MSRAWRPDAECRRASDEGFSLIEVIVSLSLLAVMSTAALYFFVGASRSVTYQQRTHGAVTLANDAMETSFSWIASSALPGTSNLVKGRTKADVEAAWAAASAAGVPGVDTTFPAWDTTTSPGPANGVGDDTIKLTRAQTESRMTYTVTTLIGTCYRATTSTGSACTKTGGDAVGAPATGYSRLMRSIVVVTWPDTNGSCSASGCRYTIASLIDPNADVAWNNTTQPKAVDDFVAVDAGSSVVIDVLANDTIKRVASNPVLFVPGSGPVKGSTPMGSLVSQSDGKFRYTAVGPGGTNPSGEVTFRYQVSGGASVTSATVHVFVKPQAPDINATGVINTDVNVPIATVIGTAPTAIVRTSGPTGGTVTASGSSFVFRHSAAGTYTFQYTYTDTEGQTSLPGKVTVVLSALAPPVVGPLTVDSRSGDTTTMNLATLSGNPGTYKTEILTVPPSGRGTILDGTVAVTPPKVLTGTASFAAGGWSGLSTFTYRVYSSDGNQVSGSGTVTVRVKPLATADTVSMADNRTVAHVVTGNDPTTSGSRLALTNAPSCNNGGSATATVGTGTQANAILVKVPNLSKSSTCVVSYRLEATDGSALVSDPVTLTVSVTP